MYNLQGSDDCIVSYSKEEISHCDYPWNVFSDECESEIVPMPVPYLTGPELELLREFLSLRVQLGEVAFRDIPPKIFNANIMNRDGKTPTGYKLVTWEPLITCDNVPLWMPDYTGIANEYHMWLHGAVGLEGSNVFYWLKAADYIGCNDLVYLLEAYCAYLYVHMIDSYMKGVGGGSGSGSGGGLSKLREWVSEERVDNKKEFRFMKAFDELKETHPLLCKQIMSRFVRHRGIRLPRIQWTDDDWSQFYRDAPGFYASLPLSEEKKAGLYVGFGM
jgi:hypothetical protein